MIAEGCFNLWLCQTELKMYTASSVTCPLLENTGAEGWKQKTEAGWWSYVPYNDGGRITIQPDCCLAAWQEMDAPSLSMQV